MLEDTLLICANSSIAVHFFSDGTQSGFSILFIYMTQYDSCANVIRDYINIYDQSRL